MFHLFFIMFVSYEGSGMVVSSAFNPKSEHLRKPTQERFVCGDPRVLVLSFSVPFKMSFDTSAYINKDVV